MVYDFDDGDFVCAVDGLAHFVVIDEDELGFNGFNDVTFGEDAGHFAFVVDDEVEGGDVTGDFSTDLGESFFGAEGDDFFFY